jgi:hypothetical protein
MISSGVLEGARRMAFMPGRMSRISSISARPFVDGGVRVGDDNVEGLLAQTANRARATTSAFTVAIDGGERLRDRTDGVRLFADKKNAAHTVLLSSIDDNSRACLAPLG